jgi:ribosomal protein S18 acetylase RimI-like enzyme
MENLIIRDAKESDYLDIKELVKQLYNDLDIKDGMEKELKIGKFKNLMKDSELIIYVADINDKVVGYLTINFNKALLDIGTTAIIDELVVHENYRRMGIGKRLVAKAVLRAEELGCSEIGVGTEFENKYAREFYKRCGFAEIGVIFEKHLIKKN